MLISHDRSKLLVLLMATIVLLLATTIVTGAKIPADQNNYMIGMGIYDVTGPAADVSVETFFKLTPCTTGRHDGKYKLVLNRLNPSRVMPWLTKEPKVCIFVYVPELW